MKAFATLLSLAFAVAGSNTATAQPIEARAACSTYQIVSTRGTFVPQNATWGYTGMITQTLAAVPGGSKFDTVYPASPNIPASPNAGVVALRTYLNAQVKACPSQKYVLLGYSQGAEVVDRVLQNVLPNKNATLYKNIKAIVLIGNPGHTPSSSANVDENGGKTTAQYQGKGPNGPVTPIPQVYVTANQFLDICYNKDSVCAADQPGSNPVAHLSYISSSGVQSLGSKFIISKLQA